MHEPNYGEAIKKIDPEQLSDLQLQTVVAHLAHITTKGILLNDERVVYEAEQIRYKEELGHRDLPMAVEDYGERQDTLAAVMKASRLKRARAEAGKAPRTAHTSSSPKSARKKK